MKVNEIFESIMGELPNIGKPCTIVRFQECNLSCFYCDAPRDTFAEMTVLEVVQAVKEFGNEHVLITGGEPLLEIDLDSVLKRLAPEHHLTIETNGTLDITPLTYYDSVVMDVKLDKEDFTQEMINIQHLGPGDAVKFVYWNVESFTKAVGFVRLCCQNAPYQIIFSPVDASNNFMPEIIALSKMMNEEGRVVDVRLQLQIHKYLGVR